MTVRHSTAAIIGLLIAALGVFNVARSAVIPSAAHFVLNVALAAAVLAVGRAVGLSWPELGLARERIADGARLGLVVAGIVAAGVVTAAIVAPTLFEDERVDVSFSDMALRVVVIIPLGTVVVEEVIFRGVLHGLLRRHLDVSPALIAGAMLFGMWHLFPVWWSYDDVAFGDLGRIGTVAGTFVATSCAGAGFIWMRVRSGHLLAPMLAHTATNSVPFMIAWILAN